MTGVYRKPDWQVEGRDWPNRSASVFVPAGGMTWHVQRMGSGPTVLLLHGTGAATHSWRALAPDLARDFEIIAPDLPGHGFTDTPGGDGLSLPGMSERLAVLMESLRVAPALIVGHSAGAAIALRLARRLRPAAIVGLNSALMPFDGLARRLPSGFKRLMFLNPLAVGAFASRAARPGRVEGLIASTGSKIDAEGLAAYSALFRTRGHLAGALGMMARWDLRDLPADLAWANESLMLVHGEDDRAVPPDVARRAHALAPGSRLEILPGLGHLAHEEAPLQTAEIIRAEAARAGLGRRRRGRAAKPLPQSISHY